MMEPDSFLSLTSAAIISERAITPEVAAWGSGRKESQPTSKEIVSGAQRLDLRRRPTKHLSNLFPVCSARRPGVMVFPGESSPTLDVSRYGSSCLSRLHLSLSRIILYHEIDWTSHYVPPTPKSSPPQRRPTCRLKDEIQHMVTKAEAMEVFVQCSLPSEDASSAATYLSTPLARSCPTLPSNTDCSPRHRQHINSGLIIQRRDRGEFGTTLRLPSRS